MMASSITKRYKSRGVPGLGRLKIGGVAMVFLKGRNACHKSHHIGRAQFS